MNKLLISLTLIFLSLSLFSQSLEDVVDETFKDSTDTEIIDATFKSIRLINSHTIKNPSKNDFYLLISHRFGYVTDGFSEMFGMDNANIRLGFEYGISDRIALGYGRSTFNKNYDFYARYKLLKQSSGNNSIPLSLSLLGVTNISSAKWPVSSRDYLFSHRMSYTFQILIARKLSNAISIQIMPTYIHRNLVETIEEENDIYAFGIGGRIKFTKRLAFTYEYHYSIPAVTTDIYFNPLSVGLDIETGGHVFQLFFTNASATFDAGFIPQTSSDWLDNQIRFGFNLLRTF